MLNHVRSWLYVGDESRPFVVLDGLPGLYGLKYDSAIACGLPLYLCSYKLGGSVTTLSLIIHMTCMSRSRARVEMTVCHSFGFAHILAYRSVGSES